MKIRTQLYPYQETGIKTIHQKFDGRALLADDPGLGKSIQAIGYQVRYLDRGPVVVICPAGLKYHWQLQYAEHANVRAEVLESRTPRPLTFRGGGVNHNAVYIANFDILGDPQLKSVQTWVRTLKAIKPQLVIIDEVHFVKDVSTIRYKAVRFLCGGVPKVIALSGTPATNCPAELWPTLNIIDPQTFNSRWNFLHRFCQPRRTPWGWEFKGATRPRTLNRLLTSTCMIRRRKEDVLKDLPAKTRTVIPVDISDRKDYDKAEADLIRWLIAHKKKSRAMRAASAERLLRVGYLRRYAAELKMKAVVGWIETFLASGGKLVVFGIHHDKVLDVISTAFKGKCVRIDGTTSAKKRQLYTDAFNTNPNVRLFIGNVDAAGVGWSCKSASDVCFVELPWTPGKVTQAEDRIHGVSRGVFGKKANIWFLVAHGTIEERLCKILQKKQSALGRVMDGKKTGEFDILSQLELALTGR